MYTCDHCRKDYKFKRNLVRHIKDRHSSIQRIACTVPDCEVTFLRKGYLLDHLKNVHRLNNDSVKHSACAPETPTPYIPICEDISEDESDQIDMNIMMELAEKLTDEDLRVTRVTNPYYVEPNYLETVCSGTDVPSTDVTTDEPGTDEPCTDVTIDKPGADNSDADIDFIMISDEEDNACTDIIESELTFETEVCVLTLTKRTGYLGDELVYKKDRVDREYYQFFK